jgi:hypothetical protein
MAVRNKVHHDWCRTINAYLLAFIFMKNTFIDISTTTIVVMISIKVFYSSDHSSDEACMQVCAFLP